MKNDTSPLEQPAAKPEDSFPVIGKNPAPTIALSNQPLTVQLSHLIKSYRELFSVSQRELAEMTGLTQATIAHLEAGAANPTLATVERLFRTLGLHLKFEARPRQR